MRYGSRSAQGRCRLGEERVWPHLKNGGGYPGFRCAGEELGAESRVRAGREAEQGKEGSRVSCWLELYKHHQLPVEHHKLPAWVKMWEVMPLEPIK